MKVIGKNINGVEVEFSISKNSIFCYNNQLTELNLPNGVEYVWCYNNQLTELVLPNGVESVSCFNNPIAEITLPKTIKYAYIPLNCIVTNLDEFKNNDKVEIRFR